MTLTRRRFLETAAALALTAAAAGALSRTPFGLVSDAAAQAPSAEDLAMAGPLGDKVEGKDDAPVTIIEYASMTCGHCAQFAATTFPKLKEKYIDTGKVRFILREFPLDPIAAAGFMIARCAGDDKYFAVVDALFARQRDWAYATDPVAGLQTLAKQFGFTQETFESCLTNQEMLDGINAVRARGAEKFGVNSTPTFFINGKIQRGAIGFEDLEKILEPLLKA
ncbi:protein-disulfide isomerase [Methylopila capsulata]|uniref:Disulfide bond formation protein DsbD n=1 Tax=Methylopila capsulata TaxID=61654 RepID=A0A9W6MTB3_9HYPH|nr:DsbA family protein [Methylopila capsulata]MBM7852878.1 protein-disulfide isomerase [Methylopila capsulata]GLK57087.1 disulfide bond formation protein DsbD [Methylopila capsulata]